MYTLFVQMIHINKRQNFKLQQSNIYKAKQITQIINLEIYNIFLLLELRFNLRATTSSLQSK